MYIAHASDSEYLYSKYLLFKPPHCSQVELSGRSLSFLLRGDGA